MKSNRLTWGLFQHRGLWWWKNLGDIPILFKRIIFTLKHTYPPQAKWETFTWFIDIMQEILEFYRYKRAGTPILIDNYWELPEDERDVLNEQAANELYDKMLALLKEMDEDNPLYEDWSLKERYTAMENAKNEFFKLFSEYWFEFWD